jgi:hypothetical protein
LNDKTHSKFNPAKFGFTERRVSPQRGKPGAVAFDDRGNAQYAWRDERMMADGEDAETRRLRSLAVANLVLVDDDTPVEGKKVSLNKIGVRVGYNPYDSGLLQKRYKKTRDLRALSKWIETRNKSADEQDEE